MSEDASATAFIGAESLRGIAASIFGNHGMRKADAAIAADVLVWANLRGIDGHGVERIFQYLDFATRGDIDLKGEPELYALADGLLLVEGNKQLGSVPMTAAMHEVVARAKSCGVALAAVRRCGHTGALGYYAQWIARQRMAAVALGSGPPLMAYHGAKAASLSTSPVAIAVPGGPGGVTMIDMATSTISNGGLLQAARKGGKIPPGFALDAEGRPTTDPARARIPMPIGGPKGSGLALMFECLASLMAGAPLLSSMLGAGKRPWHQQNQILIAVDIEKFRPPDEMIAEVDFLCATIRELPRINSDTPIRIPGERAEEEALHRNTNGIPLPKDLYDRLIKTADMPGVGG